MKREKISLDIKHTPGFPIWFVTLRDQYLGIPKDHSFVFFDSELNKIKEIMLPKDIAIGDIYIKRDQNEIILNCMELNGCLIKINLINYDYEVIEIAEEFHDFLYTKIYYWNSDFIILMTIDSYLIKICLVDCIVSFITMNDFEKISNVSSKFFKSMRKNCKSHAIVPKIKHNLLNIKFVDYEKYIYVCRDLEENNNYVYDFIQNRKMILAPFDSEDYNFEYKFGYFVTTQEYKLEVFFKSESVLKLNNPNRVYFGAKIFQDLNHRYVLVLDGCTITNADVKLTKFLLTQ